MRERLGPSKNAVRASSVTSAASIAASARRMRHCCSVKPCSRSLGRNCRITASRALSSDIGSEREKSRIGTCRAAGALPFAGSTDLFVMMPFQSRPLEVALSDRETFAVQQAKFAFDAFT